MERLLLCFANSVTQPLPHLHEEDKTIYNLLSKRKDIDFHLERESYATAEQVNNLLTQYEHDICLFHYSGHAGGSTLHFPDQLVLSRGLAERLKDCHKLKLIVLNGCCTADFLHDLIDVGVKATIIATESPVTDGVAWKFAIELYKGLVNPSPILLAIQNARKSIRLTNDITIDVIRGSLDTQEKVNKNRWCCYFPNDNLSFWFLPSLGVTSDYSTKVEGYKPNELLREMVFKLLYTNYEESLKDVYNKWLNGQYTDAYINNLQSDEITKRLPFLIAEPLRNLLSPKIEGKRFLPPEANFNRLVYYVALFNAEVDLIITTILSQIHDYLNCHFSSVDKSTKCFNEEFHNQDNTIYLTKEDINKIQDYINYGWHRNDRGDVINTIRELRLILEKCMQRESYTFFVEELDDLINQYYSDPFFKDDITFFVDLGAQLKNIKNTADKEAIIQYCKAGEEKLTSLFLLSGFWFNYRLESYRNICVIKFFQREARYKHEKIIIEAGMEASEEGFKYGDPISGLYECYSVLLIKTKILNTLDKNENKKLSFLNLSPFIIDRNGFIKNREANAALYMYHSTDINFYKFRQLIPMNPEKQYVSTSYEDLELLEVAKALREDPYLRRKSTDDFSILFEQIDAIQSMLSNLKP